MKKPTLKALREIVDNQNYYLGERTRARPWLDFDAVLEEAEGDIQTLLAAIDELAQYRREAKRNE